MIAKFRRKRNAVVGICLMGSLFVMGAKVGSTGWSINLPIKRGSNMIRLLKVEFKLLFSRLEFKLTLLVGILISSGHFITLCKGFYGEDITNVFRASDFFIGMGYNTVFVSMFYFFLFPIIAAIPYADMLLLETGSHIDILYKTRVGHKEYYMIKVFMTMISGALVIFIPLGLNYLFSFIAAPMYNYIDLTNASSNIYQPITDYLVFPKRYATSPYFHNMIFILVGTIFGSLFALNSFALSLHKKSTKLLVLLMPGIITLVSFYVLGILDLSQYQLVTYLFADQVYDSTPSIMYTYMISLLIIPVIFISYKMKVDDSL